MKIRYFLIFALLALIFSGCQPKQPVLSNEVEEAQVDQESDTTSTKALVLDEEIVKDPPVEESEVVTIVEPEPETQEAKEALPTVPNKLDYEIAFVSQAPYAVWDELHQEACEEASMIMVDKYFKKASLTPHTMEQAILDLDKWQKEKGYQVDLTAQEVSDILNNYFKITNQVVTDVTVEKIKQVLMAGQIIIIPAAGRELGNPYFQTPGPIYHMLVIKGFDDDTKEFITNDPGTKRGKDFRYQYQKLISAIHDWDHELARDGMTDEEINQGRKVMVIVGE